MTEFTRRRALVGGVAAGVASSAGGRSSWAEARAARTPRGALPVIPGLPAAPPQSVGVAPDLDAHIAAFMQRELEAGRQTGGVTAVARRGKLVHFAAHGLLDVEAGTPMTGDRLFRVMSSTKPVTAVALLQQIEARKVSLDDRVSRFIPELSGMRVRVGGDPAKPPTAAEIVPAQREITVRDLATHTSGLDGFLLDIPPGTPNTLAARVPYARRLALDFQPGTRWSYSAVTGPDVLARIVEITSGLSFDSYLKERVFDPIDMRDTAYNLTEEQRARVAPRYTREGRMWRRETTDLPLAVKLLEPTRGPNPTTTYFSGSFGLCSTARDYLLFQTMLLNGGTLHGRRVLRPESVALMRSNLVGDLYTGRGAYPEPIGGTGFGLLVRVVEDPATCGCGRAKGAYGWFGAYGTTTWTDPANDLVAVYMVQQRADAAEVEFERIIAGALIA